MILPAPYSEPVSTQPTRNYVLGAVGRRDGWSSRYVPQPLSPCTSTENLTRQNREEALQQFSAIPFFAAWDPAVLKIYVECGLHAGRDGQLKLKMPGVQEAVCFAENYAPFECFELLSGLDERVELRWLVAGKLTAQ